jgi:myo-inositol-1-phosphate synthase
MGHVGQWKIGITTNLENRLQVMKTDNPNIVGVFATHDVDNRDVAYLLESIIKKSLKQHRLNGEWFSHDGLDRDRFLEMCRRLEPNARMSVDIQKRLRDNKNNIYNK